MNIIEIRNLSKSFGDKKVLNDISFDVKKGEIYGIVGKNGAGKSTLLKCILGLIPRYDGKISGESNGKVDLKDVGSILEEPVFFGNLTGYENLLYYSRCFGIKDKKEIEELLKELKLYDAKDKKYKKYSLGMKQRLAIALSMIGNPSVLILDEPINGIDPIGIIEIRNILRKLSKEKGKTIIISSHILSEVEMLCDRCLILDGGKFIDELSEMQNEKKNNVYNITLDENNKEKIKEIFGSETNLLIVEQDDLNKTLKLLVENNIEISDIDRKNERLEDYYIQRIGEK